MKTFAMLTCTILISACAIDDAIVSDLESDKVIVELTGTDYERAIGAAQRGCQIHNKGVSDPISRRCVDRYCTRQAILFACTGELIEP